MNCLPREFYARTTSEVARDLIGHTLVRSIEIGRSRRRLSGTIVETEAYGQSDDRASHAFRGQSIRNSVMFGEVGRAYVYFTYGTHFCLNVSARNDRTEAGAVLIRSIKPIEGIEVMQALRVKDDLLDLTSGPGKLASALKITLKDNGLDMTSGSSPLMIEKGSHPCKITATARVGITKETTRAWRFIDASSPFVSKARLSLVRIRTK